MCRRASPMVDGKLWRGRWSDAAEAEVPGGAWLYIETSGDFVYVVVQFPQDAPGSRTST